VVLDANPRHLPFVRLFAVTQRQPTADSGRDREQHHRPGDRLRDEEPLARGRGFAPAQRVEWNAEEARDQFELGFVPAVALGPQVGRQDFM